MKSPLTSWLSRQFGAFASHPFSPSIQSVINSAYIRLMGLDMEEFEAPESYRTLNALFTRKLSKPRSIDQKPATVIAPCDALITEWGTLTKNRALQIKGMDYSVTALLGDGIEGKEKERVYGGDFANFYLSPRDYHRYHVPIDCRVLKVGHIPGKLYPVNIPSLEKRLDLFIENERVIVACETLEGQCFYIVLVGALNVGKMHLSFEPNIRTNSHIRTPQWYDYKHVTLSKGEELGYFEMGSTIVIISEKGLLEWDLQTDDKVKFAQTIGTLL